MTYAPLHASDRDRVLRIGFACTYSNLKPVELSILPLLRELDRGKVEPYFFSLGVAGYTQLDQLCAEHVVLLGDDADAHARAIADRRIDLLFDLNGSLREDYPIDLYARQPARLQAGWWNTPASSGLATMQYHFYDDYILLPEDRSEYTEKVITIPGTANCCYEFTRDYALAPAPCTASGVFTFGSFTALFKHNDAVLNAWMEILHRAPGTRLYLKAQGTRSPRFKRRLARIAEEHGIDPQRLLVEHVSTFDVMMEKYAEVDLALGTFSYGPGTTSMNALWQGVPSLVCDGIMPQSRTVGSILLDAGLPEFIVPDVGAYIDRAVRLAAQPQSLIDLRPALRPRLIAQSTHFNAARFARNFEQACHAAWHDHIDKHA